jgi:hypothetical protein
MMRDVVLTTPLRGLCSPTSHKMETRQAARSMFCAACPDHPMDTAHRELVHKIGVTSNGVKQRIADAHMQPTFLFAEVEVVATYELFNINRSKLENLIHRIFGPARFDMEILDRFGRPVVPHESFMVPLFVIDEAVERIRDQSIVDDRYDPASAKLVKLAS